MAGFTSTCPRPRKYEHNAQFPIRAGTIRGDLPETALICNLPGGTPGDPGLMTHDDVISLFHEFGHLIHELLGGRQKWEGISGARTQWDFVEAPSQMLEEWTWDPAARDVRAALRDPRADPGGSRSADEACE